MSQQIQVGDLGQSYISQTDMNDSFVISQGDREAIKYQMQSDKVVGYYKKVLSDIRGTIQKERKQVQKYLN